ncbi:MAG: DNRLRE domain-containing protein [Mycobacteriales bacterium]
MRIRVVAAVVVAALGAALASPALGVAGPAATAADRAGRTGHRVEIPGARTPTGQLYANPDGTYTLEERAEPVRARRGVRWVPVDTRLRAGAGGVVPAAVTLPLRFSAGGTGPLVRLGGPDRYLELTWPGRLPAPSLAGDTATYADVLPGVDLRLRAEPRGYSEVLVVKTRAAATNPALARVDFGLGSHGLAVLAAADQSLTAVDAAGRVLFRSPPPRMWDAGDTAAPARAPDAGPVAGRGSATGPAGGPAAGPRTATGRVAVAGRTLSVLPDPAFLADPGTRYPVSVDPDWSAGLNGWAEVYQQYPTQSYWGGDGDAVAKVGYNDWSGSVTVRSYFQFDLARLAGADVISAEFNDRENWSWSCTAREVDAYEAGPVHQGTLTWNNQPALTQIGSQTVAHGYAGCPAGYVGFDATKPVRDGLAAGGGQLATIMLRAANEADDLAWKKFDTNPTLIVTFDTPPTVPTAPATDGLACTPGSPGYLADTAPVLHVTAADPDGGQVAAHFQWTLPDGTTGEATTAYQQSGTSFAVPVPAGTYGDGATISWRAQTLDGRDASGWTDPCAAVVDVTAPAQRPDVSSTDFPPAGTGLPAGHPGTFTFGAAGVADVAGYRYGLTSPPSTAVAAAGLGGPATVQVTPTQSGPASLYVRSVDRAGNLGPITRYDFFVGVAS